MKKIAAALFLLCLAAADAFCQEPFQATRVAVPVFEDASGCTSYSSDLRQAVTDMLVAELAKTKGISLVERARLDTAVNESRLSLAGMVDPQTAVTVGNLVGASYLVLGTVTKASIEEKTTNFIISTHSRKALVTLVVRVVDAQTGLTVSSAEAGGDADRSSASLDPALMGVKNNNQAVAPVGGGTVGYDQSGLLREAAAKAVAKLAPKVCDAIPKNAAPDAEGYVVKVDASRVFVDLGLGQVSPGTALLVQRFGEELIHPVTGKSLGKEQIKLGNIKVLEVFEGYSVAEIQDGAGFMPGDRVRVTH
ncbi:MAG: CsgG/HfaB family protein [Thermodesulfobacteriota bacterium]